MWEIIFYTKESGNSPVEEFLDSISNMKLRAKMIKEIELLEEFGNKLRKPHTKSIADNRGSMLELRAKQSTNISRIFFFYIKGNKIILLNGLIKKTNKTPKANIDLAFTYKNDYEKRCRDEK